MWEILIIICLSAIFIIFLRRLPEVEIQGAPEERQNKTKIEKILENLDRDDIEQISSNQREIKALSDEAEGYFHKREFDRAEELYIKVATLDPDNAHTYGRLGVIYLLNKNYQDAKEALEVATKYEQKNGFWYNNLGLALFNLKKYSESIDAYKKSIELGGDVAARYYNLGLAYIEVDQIAEAQAALEKAYELEPQNKSYFRLLQLIKRKKISK